MMQTTQKDSYFKIIDSLMKYMGVWKPVISIQSRFDTNSSSEILQKVSLRGKRFHLAWFRSKERPRAKKWKRGEGKEGNACRQTPRFWKPAFASERSDWLARLVEQYWYVSMKGLFHTERSCMVCDTHVVVVVYSGRQDLLDLPSFFWNAKFFLRLNKGFWSFLLLSKVPPGSK